MMGLFNTEFNAQIYWRENWSTINILTIYPVDSVVKPSKNRPFARSGNIKITHAGEQVTQWDFQNKATRTCPTWPAFILEVPPCNLLTGMCDFDHVTGSCKASLLDVHA